MTPGELKFALLLESHLNSLPDPEFRQLVVECLMVVSLVATSSPQPTFGDTLVVEHIIHHAHHLFLQDQVSGRGQAKSALCVYCVLCVCVCVCVCHSESTGAQQRTAAVTM